MEIGSLDSFDWTSWGDDTFYSFIYYLVISYIYFIHKCCEMFSKESLY